jgi:RNA polymerase sigma-70 factor (ECF subfamily)
MRLVKQPAVADVVLQDTYISVWERAGSYASSSSAPLAWLVAALREHALRRTQHK